MTVQHLDVGGTDDLASRVIFRLSSSRSDGSTDKTLKLYEGHVHDLLNDIDKEIVMADIIGWLDLRAPKA
jgi:alpha-beta hydrolase superfamily lysophospholipase